MIQLRIINQTRGCVLGARVGLADAMGTRARGLIGRPRPGQGEGLMLSPCRAIHTLGMRYAIDVIFLDRDGCVVALYPELRPGRFAWHPKATFALEVPTGTIEASGTAENDKIAWQPTDLTANSPSSAGEVSDDARSRV